MTAVRMWVRADLRRRWRSWVVLGLLAGVTVGLAAAGIAGARRADRAVPAYAAASHVPTAIVLANDPGYDAAQRDAVASLPEVAEDYPFMVAFMLEVKAPAGLDGALVPTEPRGQRVMSGVVVEGRAPDPSKPDEAIVNEAVRDQFGVGIGDTITVEQQPDPELAQFLPELPPNVSEPIEQVLHVVGIADSPDGVPDWMPSAGFYAKYESQLVGFVNQMIDLRNGQADVARFRADVAEITGRPTNVESSADIFGTRQLEKVADVVRNGLLLFALAVIIGGGVLVGQALVRAVSAGASDLATWRALGADRRIAVRAIVAPTLLVAFVGTVTAIGVGIALSPRFPIAVIRRYDLDRGVHADWPVLAVAGAAFVLATVVAAWTTAEIRVRRTHSGRARTPLAARWAVAAGLPPALLIGSRLAVESGRGNRAVPVRSAMIGAIVGVIGIVGCLTVRNGLSDTVDDPARSGVVWDFALATPGSVEPQVVDEVAHDPAVSDSLDAVWARAVDVDDTATPTFGVSASSGPLAFVMVEGRAPRTPDEIAIAPTTMRGLGLHVGDTTRVGIGDREVRVVGSTLMPATSHTSYDQSAWMTAEGLEQSLPPPDELGPDFFETHLLLRWKPDADVAAATARLSSDDTFELQPAALPPAVDALGALRSLPLTLAIFFALLAIATVAHALVTTVRRRRQELAVLRALGFTRRATRVAIAWQATLLAVVGLVVGIPLGIVVGRLAWKQIAEEFPVVYAPPLAVVAIALIIPIAIVVANALAAGPAHAATRIRPARALRTE